MSSELVFCIGLALLILAVAGFTIGVKEDFAAVVGFVVYGLLLSLAWMSLSSPDVALTEAAVGGGVTGALLLGACARLRTREKPAEGRRPGWIDRGAALVLCAGISADWRALCCSFLIRRPPSRRRRRASLGNGSWQCCDRGFDGLPGFGHAAGKSGAAPGAGRRLVAGARSFLGRPAGVRVSSGAGGSIDFSYTGLGSGWCCCGHPPFLGGGRCSGRRLRGRRDPGRYGYSRVYLRVERGSRCERLPPAVRARGGVIVFIVAGLAGFAWASGFLAYPVGFAKPIILLIELAMIFSIGATLALLVAGPPGRS
jgi:uncharacterized MnhB-related membrane protein